MREQPQWGKALLGLPFLAEPRNWQHPWAREELEDEDGASDTCTSFQRGWAVLVMLFGDRGAMSPLCAVSMPAAPFLSLPNPLTCCLHLSLHRNSRDRCRQHQPGRRASSSLVEELEIAFS